MFFGSIRGRLAAITLLARNIGVLLGYVLFATVKYEHIPIISASIFIIFIILFIWQPNTPRYYIRNGQFEVRNSTLDWLKGIYFVSITLKQAVKSLRYYKGYIGKSESEDAAIQDEMERLKSVESEQKMQEKLRMSDFCKCVCYEKMCWTLNVTIVLILQQIGAP